MTSPRPASHALAAAGTAILSAAAASAAPPTMAIWARGGTNTPISSPYSGSSWGSPAALPAFSSNTRWIVARTCPTRDELVTVALDSDKKIRLAFHRDAAWTTPSLICAKTATAADRCFDAAYERVSGDLLAVYWNSDAKKLGYRTATGGAISGESTLSLGAPNGGHGDHNNDQKVRYITLAPDPASNRIMLLSMQDDKDLLAVQWDGSSWGPPQVLESDCESDGDENYAAAYECLSGRALVAYAQKNHAQPRYRTFGPSGFSAEMAAPSIGKTARWIRLAPRPGTDDILMVCLDKDKDISALLWSGASSSWGSVTELSDDARHHNRRCFDVAFEATGNRALAVYSHKNKDDLYFRTWTPAAGWSAEQKGPTLSGDPDVVLLRPATIGSTIFVLASTSSKDLYAARWTGSALSDATRLETNLATADGIEQFAFTDNPASAGAPRITRWIETNP